MRLVLDACVLYPTIMREALLAVAAEGLFQPLWSERILGEWQHAAIRHNREAEALQAIARARDGFARAMVPPRPGLEARLHLPDENDIHVLATAIAGNADAIVTLNAADFPRGTLAAEGLERRDPDGVLWQLWSHHPEAVNTALERLRATASRLSGDEKALAPLLKRAGLTRLARAVGTL